MSTEPATLSAAIAPAPAAVQVPDKAPRKPLIPPQYIAPLFITAVLIAAHQTEGMLKGPWHLAAAVGAAMLMEAVLGKLNYGKIPNLASAYVSGISAGILVRTEEIWPLALTACVAITSKYVLRWKGRHLWNPTNFAIAALLLVMHQRFATLSTELGNSHGSVIVIWILGGFIIAKLKRLHICLTFVASFILFAGVRSVITGETFLSEVAPVTGPMYQLFTFFMITDPKTTVTSKKGQMLVAFLVAAVECVLRLFHNIHAPYFALFTVGPIANLVEIWWLDRQKRLAPTAPPNRAGAAMNGSA